MLFFKTCERSSSAAGGPRETNSVSTPTNSGSPNTMAPSPELYRTPEGVLDFHLHTLLWDYQALVNSMHFSPVCCLYLPQTRFFPVSGPPACGLERRWLAEPVTPVLSVCLWHVSGQNYGKNARFQRINRFWRPRPVSGRPVCCFEHLLLSQTNTQVVSKRL